MLFVRILALSIALSLTIGMRAQVQPSKPGTSRRTPEEKLPAASLSHKAHSQDPFDSLTEFSATRVGGLNENMGEIKVARSGNLMWVQAYNKINHLVTNLSTRETYFMLMQPRERCIRNVGLAEQSFPFGFFRPGFKIERTPVGQEVVDGHHCHVESVARTSPTGNVVHVKFWEADDLKGFPVKVEVERPGQGAVTMTYKDVKMGAPDPALFVHPKNCLAGLEPNAR